MRIEFLNQRANLERPERNRHPLVGIGALLTLTTILLAYAFLGVLPRAVSARQATSPGLEPYTPTKIEWLHLECIAVLHSNLSLEKDGFVLAPQLEKDDTIVIYVAYRPTVDRKKMNETIDTYRMIIGTLVKKHRWESWVKVKEELAPLGQ